MMHLVLLAFYSKGLKGIRWSLFLTVFSDGMSPPWCRCFQHQQRVCNSSHPRQALDPVDDAIFEICHWLGQVADMSGNSNPHASWQKKSNFSFFQQCVR